MEHISYNFHSLITANETAGNAVLRGRLLINDISMNSRGLEDLIKHQHIADFIRDYNLDFVAITETGRRDFQVSVLDRLSGGVDFT